MIGEAEKRTRQEAVASVIGTHRAEGIGVDAETKAIMNRYAEGELTLTQFSAAMRAHAEAMLEKSGHLASAV